MFPPTPIKSKPDRSERREERKLQIEYAKLLISLLGIGTLFFAGLQWLEANNLSDQAVYQRITNEWRDHLRTFVERPHLRPYFEERKALADDDLNRDVVLALADVRLDVMDAILVYGTLRWSDPNVMGAWNNMFTEAFRKSPAMCDRLMDHASSFNRLLVGVGADGCGYVIEIQPVDSEGKTADEAKQSVPPALTPN